MRAKFKNTVYSFYRHVHEKAILLVILPYTVLSFLDAVDAKLLPILSLTGHVSLMPLLFRHQEFMIKVSKATHKNIKYKLRSRDGYSHTI